jgi:hypothetical protein
MGLFIAFLAQDPLEQARERLVILDDHDSIAHLTHSPDQGATGCWMDQTYTKSASVPGEEYSYTKER